MDERERDEREDASRLIVVVPRLVMIAPLVTLNRFLLCHIMSLAPPNTTLCLDSTRFKVQGHYHTVIASSLELSDKATPTLIPQASTSIVS